MALTRRKFISMVLSSAALNMLPLPKGIQTAEASLFDSNKEVVIIGGGISGLVAAYILRDQNILLLEAEDRFGGRAIGGQKNGWHYTKGTEYLGKPEGILAEIIDELGLELQEIPTPMDQIWRDGKYHKGLSGRIQLLTQKGGIEPFKRFLKALKQISIIYDEIPYSNISGEIARLDNITCAEWFAELQLPKVYYEMYNVTFRGLFGANINEVSALGAFPEIAFDFEGIAPHLKRVGNHVIVDEKIDTNSDAYSFRTGITEVTDALAKKIGDKGLHSAKVTSVAGNDESGYVITYHHGNDIKKISAQSVIFATPTPVSLEIGSHVLTSPQQDILRQVPYSQYVTAALFSDSPIYTDAFDLALPDDWFVTDVYDSTWMQKMLGEKHKGYIASLYIGPLSYKDEELITMNDKELLEKSWADLQKIWPDIATKITGYDIHRFKYGYPVMTIGAYDRLTKLYGMMTGAIQIAGDGMIYPTFEGAAQAGEIAASRIKKWL